jgi:glycosyltransferase involved in cell wall biosynthesis
MKVIFAGRGAVRLSGGSLMAMLIAEGFVELGHEVRVFTEGEPPWMPFNLPIVGGSIDSREDLRWADAVVTGPDGVEAALDSGVGVVGQLCTGYEPHLWPRLRAKYEALYRLPAVKLVIAEHLRKSLRSELDVDAVVIGAPVELARFRAEERASNPASHRVLLVGPEPNGPFAPVPFKGIGRALEIVAEARRVGCDLEVVRLTPIDDPLRDHPEVDETHIAVAPAEVPDVYRSCDVYLGASTPAEGFGMPAVEAAVSGLAGVLPTIPSFLEIPNLGTAAEFYPAGDVRAGARVLAGLLADPERLRARQLAGPRAGLEEHFSPRRVAARAAAALRAT